MDLTKFDRFEGIVCRLTKLESKRASAMPIGHNKTGVFSLFTYSDPEDGQVGAVVSRGFSFLRTSPIVGIVDENETSLKFETEGGIYSLEVVGGDIQ